MLPARTKATGRVNKPRASSKPPTGNVTETRSESAADRIGCRHGSAPLPPSSLSARDHPARNLAVSPLHPELPRCRGIAGRTRARHLLRNGTALGAEVRSRDRTTAASASTPAERSLAVGRDGGADRRRADVSLAEGEVLDMLVQ